MGEQCLIRGRPLDEVYPGGADRTDLLVLLGLKDRQETGDPAFGEGLIDQVRLIESRLWPGIRVILNYDRKRLSRSHFRCDQGPGNRSHYPGILIMRNLIRHETEA